MMQPASAASVPLPPRPELHGLAGAIVRAWHDIRARGEARRGKERELQVVETLAIGGRKQLLLVSCAGERFLVGVGADAVGSIVRVTAEEIATSRSGEGL